MELAFVIVIWRSPACLTRSRNMLIPISRRSGFERARCLESSAGDFGKSRSWIKLPALLVMISK